MMVVLFLGGWTLPFPGWNEPARSIWMGLAHVGAFLFKLLVLMLLFIWIRWMLPRFRYDQLMDLGWRRFIPIALANIVGTAIVLWIRSA
jgi:NADH-quinone oxidoreductase subunit H